MASSSINPSTSSDNNKLNQLSETRNEGEKDLPLSSSNVEEIIDEPSVNIITRRPQEQDNEISSDVIQKKISAPLKAACISSTVLARDSLFREKRSAATFARPFEEFLIGQPNTDVPPGTFTKPNENKSSFTKKPS
ncbi:unnamed protein product [Rotaria sp. Silwood1]|nr:unnamed protein product [Rotaria sp. Silwood1]CAF0833182.1 unnamed protein product [Rotaria sp. Silwood1]CAF0931080.1 unnamed protein product [Rotaria sp. Silwood1]CAF3338898.1 unnamed protein product [Rotaria sp. Silwood1]CAF3399151.1 unnamed protein product [Rotaria sp. Silwood1]